ncbi:MAG: membrane protein insertion efficiency factor YidD [Deltaproteobacteria bacterium]|nr:membrane protein insertion efficiency factor YidD [Deltaproteobacteria bacterium]MBW2070683.1 membrane protein insertion efficiency factor YidD [Deltaproteobacteria bacterium]
MRPAWSLPAKFFSSLVRFFQKVISPVDGNRCPSYPTCSAYSRQAFEKHGFLLGTLMTVDRLYHEASEEEYAPMVVVHGVRRIYDPLWANEFWRHPGKGQKQWR